MAEANTDGKCEGFFPSLPVPADRRREGALSLACSSGAPGRGWLSPEAGGDPAFLGPSWSLLLLYRAGRILPPLPRGSGPPRQILPALPPHRKSSYSRRDRLATPPYPQQVFLSIEGRLCSHLQERTTCLPIPKKTQGAPIFHASSVWHGFTGLHLVPVAWKYGVQYFHQLVHFFSPPCYSGNRQVTAGIVLGGKDS